MYKDYAMQLIDSGNAYYAFDSAEELAKIRTEYEQNHKNFQYDCHTREHLKNSLTLSKEQTQTAIRKWCSLCCSFSFS
jgi:glutamyl-tRNA synthetase